VSLKTHLENTVDYNTWVAEQLVGWLENYPDELLHKECPSSFNSIAKTIKHLSDTQRYWSAIIRETAIPEFEYIPSYVDAKAEMKNLVTEAWLLADYVEENIEGMSEPVLIESQWFSSNFPKSEYLQHLLIHSTYHRGQIVTIGHNVGVGKAPMLDYNFWNVVKTQ
jgi:uncharacterized damage-inducible protein DinB